MYRDDNNKNLYTIDIADTYQYLVGVENGKKEEDPQRDEKYRKFLGEKMISSFLKTLRT